MVLWMLDVALLIYSPFVIPFQPIMAVLIAIFGGFTSVKIFMKPFYKIAVYSFDILSIVLGRNLTNSYGDGTADDVAAKLFLYFFTYPLWFSAYVALVPGIPIYW